MDKYFAAADKVLDQIFPFPGQQLKECQGLRRPAGETRREERTTRCRSQVLERFLPRAYRRPIEPREIERLLAIFDAAQKKGESFEESIRWAIKGILVSPNFLFRIEADREPSGSDKSYRISDPDWRYGCRTSYGRASRTMCYSTWPGKANFPTRPSWTGRSSGCWPTGGLMP